MNYRLDPQLADLIERLTVARFHLERLQHERDRNHADQYSRITMGNRRQIIIGNRWIYSDLDSMTADMNKIKVLATEDDQDIINFNAQVELGREIAHINHAVVARVHEIVTSRLSVDETMSKCVA